jgi:hypothetical protein
MPRLQFAALTLAAIALAATGCGGSSKTSSTAANAPAVSTSASTTAASTQAAGTPLTRAALIASGDPICARANAKTSVLTANTVRDYVRIFPQIALYHRTEAAELAKLSPPASLTHDWRQMVSDLELQSRYVTEAAHDLAQKNDHAAAKHYERANAMLSGVIAIGRRDGFAHCSKLS